VAKKKTKRGLDEESWLELVDCYRRDAAAGRAPKPPAAARIVGCDPKTAKKALYDGYAPGRVFKDGKRPILDLLAAERALDRESTEIAKFEVEAGQELTIAERLITSVNAALSNVVDSRAQSGIGIHLARKSTTNALASAARLAKVGDLLAERMVEQITTRLELRDDKGQLVPIDTKDSMEMLREIARFTKDSTTSLQIVDDLERRHLGSEEDIRKLMQEISKTESIEVGEEDHIIQVGLQSLGLDEPSEFVDMSPEVVDAEFEELQKGMMAEDEREEDDTEGLDEEEETEETEEEVEGQTPPASDVQD
jgi:hypothetical protein